jgi:predicted exporter
MRDFRREATIAVGTAVVLILSLLTLERIGLRRLLWIASTVTGSLAVTIAVVVYIHGALTLIHLVALLLVLGLDLDYALFFSREDSLRGRQATLRSIIACAASTVLPFFILSQSSIPVLKFIGLTVATGSSASFILAYLGQRSRNLSTD